MTLRMRCVKVSLGGENANPAYTSEFQAADGKPWEASFFMTTRKPAYAIGSVYKLVIDDQPEHEDVILLVKEEAAATP